MSKSRYKTIVDQLAADILSGELKPGTQLPTVRELMKTHKVALATSAKIYGALEAIGLVIGETGRGTFVLDRSLPRMHGFEQMTSLDGAVDLTFNYPVLPGQVEMLREGLITLASSRDVEAVLHSAPQGGQVHERQVVAKHLRNRGIRVSGEQVLIVNGAQQGLAVAAMTLFKPGDVLAVDELTYPGIKAVSELFRLDVEPLPLGDGGAWLEALECLCRRRRVRGIYSMPTMHNPLGTVMDDWERKRLVTLADRHDFFIIEDAAYAFLADPAPAPLFVHAPHRTVYVSGLSKSVAPGLRFGFICADIKLIPAFESCIRALVWSSPTMVASLACQWIESGVVDDLEDRKRDDAQYRQCIVQRVLRGCSVRAHPSSYYAWITLREKTRADLVASRLKANGVLVSTAAPFATTLHVPHALRLALGSIPHTTLEAALHKVRAEIDF